jgi:hypothetical protein
MKMATIAAKINTWRTSFQLLFENEPVAIVRMGKSYVRTGEAQAYEETVMKAVCESIA